MIVQPFGIIAMAEGGEEVAGGGEGVLCPEGFHIVLIAALDVMKWEGINRLVVKRIGEATKIFPAIIFLAIGHIGFSEPAGA